MSPFTILFLLVLLALLYLDELADFMATCELSVLNLKKERHGKPDPSDR